MYNSVNKGRVVLLLIEQAELLSNIIYIEYAIGYILSKIVYVVQDGIMSKVIYIEQGL